MEKSWKEVFLTNHECQANITWDLLKELKS
jgi:hypothetical protein